MVFLGHYGTKKLFRILNTLFALLLILNLPLKSYGNNSDSQEYLIKAGFLYKFLFFVEWPTEVIMKSSDSITIGILGRDPFGDAFEPIEGDIIHNRNIVIKHFEKNVSADYLKQCNLIFISSSIKDNTETILQSIKEYPVLTISEVAGFVDQGGMVNFIMKENRVRFEINREAAERVGIKFRSKLLRVAERVVGAGHAD